MIYTPSYKRAGSMQISNYLGSDFTICCHSFEYSDYKIAYPKNKIMELPDDLQGNLSKVRNYILDNSKENNIVFMDDDIKSIKYYESNQRIILSKLELFEFIRNGFSLASQLGTVLWGTNITTMNIAYKRQIPFSLSTPICCPFMGIIKTNNNIRFDESLSLNEDFDYTLQVLEKYRKVLRFNKYHYVIKEFLTQKGGCSLYRTYNKEKIQADLMLSKWGKNVRYDFKKNKFNPILNVNL